MNYDYWISNFRWRLESDYPLTDTPASRCFRAENVGQPDWLCQVRAADTLPSPGGRLLSQCAERRLYREDRRLWLELLNRKDGQPIFCAAYPVDGGAPVQLWSLACQHPYTARMEHIWSAVDFPFHLLQKGILTLHSACIEVDGQAILFFAPSGVGKSTQARLWQQLRGAQLRNGDKTGLVCRGGTVTACGLPFCGTSGVCTDFRLPVRALVLLSQAKDNSIRRLTGASALQAVLANCFGHRSVPECVDALMAAAAQLLQQTPVYALACTPDERAVETLERELGKER